MILFYLFIYIYIGVCICVGKEREVYKCVSGEVYIGVCFWSEYSNIWVANRGIGANILIFGSPIEATPGPKSTYGILKKCILDQHLNPICGTMEVLRMFLSVSRPKTASFRMTFGLKLIAFSSV
jgi:hypothetical protein